VAKRRRDVTFVLGGREPNAASDSSASWWPDYQRLREQPNVHFIGWVPHEALGAHLASFNVLIMPYAACRFNTNACPAKLWDYMGTSRPIVANDVVPEVNLWDDVIHITETPDDFASALDEAVDEGPELPARRLKIARNHTYSALGRRAADLLASTLGR
jgi:glycosyltransferase involved in cell wall biosynthesis